MTRKTLEGISALNERIAEAATKAGCSEAVRYAPIMKTLAALAAIDRAAGERAREIGLRAVWPAHVKASEGVREGSLSEAEAVALVRSAKPAQ